MKLNSGTVSRALLICFLIAASTTARCQKACSASPLSKAEARKLMEFLPQAEDAKQIGGELSVIDWDPGTDYRVSIFYFFQVLSTKSPPNTPLDNGMIGYFGVNKTSGQVIELNSGQPYVEGKALRGKQEDLRAKHCISQELVTKSRNVPLEK